MKGFTEGDIVACRIKSYSKMIVIDVILNNKNKKLYSCRWFKDLTQEYVVNDFYGFELKGVEKDG